MRIVGLCVVLALLTACVANNIEAETKPIRSGSVISLVKKLVADRMRDPEATRFRNDFATYQTNRGDYIFCGTLNAKNAMGGYVGYRQFYVRIRGNEIASLLLPGENDQYAIVAQQVREGCADAASGTIMVSS